MKMLVVYDSVFGNTEQVARAIGNGLGGAEDVGIVRAGDVRPEQLTPGRKVSKLTPRVNSEFRTMN